MEGYGGGAGDGHAERDQFGAGCEERRGESGSGRMGGLVGGNESCWCCFAVTAADHRGRRAGMT